MRRDGNVLICVDTAGRVLELAQLLVSDVVTREWRVSDVLELAQLLVSDVVTREWRSDA